MILSTKKVAAYIAGDWGTSQSRFWLCASDGTVLDNALGEGIAVFNGNAAQVETHFQSVSRNWPETLPVVLCGMAGSISGWRECDYIPTPVHLTKLGYGGICFQNKDRTVILLPGVSTTNGFGQVDVMRGEETQLAGALPRINATRTIIALPGTHNKWCLIEDQELQTFHTSMSGELHAILCKHSILTSKIKRQIKSQIAFEDGVRTSFNEGKVGLEALLYSCRARQALNTLKTEDASSYLSGLLIGSDIMSAKRLYTGWFGKVPIFIICSEPLSTLYRRALEMIDLSSQAFSGEEIVQTGLHKAYLFAFAG